MNGNKIKESEVYWSETDKTSHLGRNYFFYVKKCGRF